MAKKKVLLIGWDAADWKVINPLMDAGKMPALEKLVNGGIIGNMATLDPPLSPMLWTSVATGMRADKHGILGFAEPVPNVGGVRPINVTSRKVHAIWNILNSKGFKCNVVSWWPSHPAEPIDGVVVSNFFKTAGKPYGNRWPMLQGTIHPEEMANKLKKYRVHPGELTAAHILPFVPDAGKIDQEKDKRLASVAKITADAASVQAVSTWLMENTEWDFMAVYFDSIDHYGHGFMKFRAPQMEGVPDDLFNTYKEVVDGGYIFHDMMLERMLHLAGEDTTVILISDHGFHSDHLRPLSLPKLPAAPALEHRPYGVICMAGPGIRKDERIYGASLLDVAPTILSIYDLPLGKDMDGKVLLNAFEEPKLPEYIESWEKEKGKFGNHPDHIREDTHGSAEALKQLVELGYIEDPGPDKNKAMENVTNEANYNLSKVHASAGRYDKAIQLIEALYEKNSNDIRYNLDLANLYLQTKKIREAEKIVAK
nr:alkaline phosphatase family protein [Bacteroidota bacterium]